MMSITYGNSEQWMASQLLLETILWRWAALTTLYDHHCCHQLQQYRTTGAAIGMAVLPFVKVAIETFIWMI